MPGELTQINIYNGGIYASEAAETATQAQSRGVLCGEDTTQRSITVRDARDPYEQRAQRQTQAITIRARAPLCDSPRAKNKGGMGVCVIMYIEKKKRPARVGTQVYFKYVCSMALDWITMWRLWSSASPLVFETIAECTLRAV